MRPYNQNNHGLIKNSQENIKLMDYRTALKVIEKNIQPEILEMFKEQPQLQVILDINHFTKYGVKSMRLLRPHEENHRRIYNRRSGKWLMSCRSSTVEETNSLHLMDHQKDMNIKFLVRLRKFSFGQVKDQY